MANDPLRGCPVCGTPIAEADHLGLRDYRWLNDELPGKIAPMDIDFILEKNERFLIHEYKPKGAPLRQGQRLTLRALKRRAGADIWVVNEVDPRHFDISVMEYDGATQFTEKRVPLGRLKRASLNWLDTVVEEGRR
jgi:hypothetical protein